MGRWEKLFIIEINFNPIPLDRNIVFTQVTDGYVQNE